METQWKVTVFFKIIICRECHSGYLIPEGQTESTKRLPQRGSLMCHWPVLCSSPKPEDAGQLASSLTSAFMIKHSSNPLRNHLWLCHSQMTPNPCWVYFYFLLYSLSLMSSINFLVWRTISYHLLDLLCLKECLPSWHSGTFLNSFPPSGHPLICMYV